MKCKICSKLESLAIDEVVWVIVLISDYDDLVFSLSRDQGITDPIRWTCGSTVGNQRIKQGEKAISSHVQEFTGIPDMDFDGKQSQTAIGKNYALKTYE